MSNNACVDEESLRNLLLEQTEIYSRLLTAQIAQSKCARLIRMDHSQKFCGKLKVWVVPKLDIHADPPPVCVCDDANKTRSLITSDLSSALYGVSGNIRTPEEVATRFNTVLQGVDVSSARVNASTWQNCISVNLEQIRNGDLYVEDNEYMDNGKRVRVVSTSQLEGLHSKLRKLLDRIVSIEVGMRILDIFLLKVRLSC
eukprot:jgi/Phyca11/105902/e_gw1.11.669.1